MNDPEIRKKLFTRLSKRRGYRPERVVEEASINNGSIRADVVYCSNHLECFEIKGENDSLKRLVAQGWQYGQSFDYVTLVCASKHLDKSLYILPEWWGIIEVKKDGSLKSVRRTSKNPDVNVRGIVDLLANDETRDFLRKNGVTRGVSSSSHSELRRMVSQHNTLADIRKWAIDALIKRNHTRQPPTVSYIDCTIGLSAQI